MSRIFLVSLLDEYALGIRYIASTLEAAGHDVRLAFLKDISDLRDASFEPADAERLHETPLPVLERELDLLVQEARGFSPELIGISLVSSVFGLASAATRAFRERLGIPVAWGGVEPTVNPDLAQEHADVICVGEGERAMAELASRLDSHRSSTKGPPLRALAGFRQPIDNLMIRTGDGWLSGRLGIMEQDLDRLPFPLFDPGKESYVAGARVYRGAYPPSCRLPLFIPAISFRGCPYQCTYCCHSALKRIYGGGRYLRRRSVGNFVDELVLRQSQFPDLQLIEIEDDVFTLDQRWIDEFAGSYRARVKAPFWCYTYPGISRESMLAPLKEAGLASVTFGIQSGSQRVLEELYGRPAQVESIVETSEVLHRLGIPFVVDLIGSNPLETDADRAETVRVLASLPKPYKLHRINPMSFYRRYPLTERAMAAGVPLVQGRGTTIWCPPPDPRFRAWDALFTLAHYPGIAASTLEPLWKHEGLMRDPEPLEQLSAALAQATYHEGNLYRTKDDRIREEEGKVVALRREVGNLEGELRRLHGSRIVRLALRLRSMLR